MASKSPTIIFVVGAWHTDFHLRLIKPDLEKYGYRVLPITLRTSIKSTPAPTLQDNAADILQAMQREADAGNPFVLLGHSVAGLSTTLAANEFLATATPQHKALFVHYVWIACFLNGHRIAPYLTWASTTEDGAWIEVKDPHATFYNDMSIADAQPYIDALEANVAAWPPEYGDAYKSVQGTYLLCLNDRAIPPEEVQRLEAQENGMRIVELKADHVPFVSHPEETAEALHNALKRG